MKWEEIVKYLEENKDSEDVKALLDKMRPLSLEAIKAFIASDPEAIKWFASERDRAVTKGITTYEQNTLPKKIEEATKDLVKEPSAQDKRLAELERQSKERDLREARLTLQSKALEGLAKENLPISMAKFLIGTDEEETTLNLKLFKTEVDAKVAEVVGERLKKLNIKPGDNKHDDTPPSTVNPWKPETLNLTLQGELIKKDPEKAKALAKVAGITLELET